MKRGTKTFSAALVAASLIAGALVAGVQYAKAEDNGLEQTPLLGWSSWSFIREHPTAVEMEDQARALKNSGLNKLGYRYVNLDDFWYVCPSSDGPNVDAYGRWVTDPVKFPPKGDSDGMKVIADYMHSLGFKFGIYVTPGISKQAVAKNTQIKGTQYTASQIAVPAKAQSNYNCKGMIGVDYSKPGAQQFTNSWVDMFASWGVDYIKIDGMRDANTADVEAWSKAIRQSGRPMVLDVTPGHLTTAIAPTLMKFANQWVVSPDVECYSCEKNETGYPLTSWANIAKRFNAVNDWQAYAAPGGFSDYDSIEVGNGTDNGITPDERKTQLSLWALAAAPLILGVDLIRLDPQDLQLLKNTAVLAVDQDSIAAKRVVNTSDQQVFTKKEANGDVIVGLFNTGDKAQDISIQASVVGLSGGKSSYSVKDLWTGKTMKAGGAITAAVPSHGVALYRVR